MNILVTAATDFELEGLRESVQQGAFPHLSVEFLATGVGGVATAYILTKVLQQSAYDLVLNVGIAGSFNPQYPIGQTVLVENEVFADLGIGTPQGYRTLFEERLADENQLPYTNGYLHCPYINDYLALSSLPCVKGVTVNTTSGNDEQIKLLVDKFNPDVESMEGAAFFFVCLQEKVPFMQIRSISNKVEPRNRKNWDIPLALKNLNNTVMQLLISL